MKKAISRIQKNALESISEELSEMDREMQAEEELFELARAHKELKAVLDRF
jgi:hypothetical protein